MTKKDYDAINEAKFRERQAQQAQKQWNDAQQRMKDLKKKSEGGHSTYEG